MKATLCFLLLLLLRVSSAQNANARLRTELERIHDLDQGDRHAVHSYPSGAQMDSVIAHMTLQDSLDLARVSAIIDSAGWLGAEEIGHKANQALFLVIQHADRWPKEQESFLPLMRDAVKNGKARADELAMLEDRVAVNSGRPQIYGSQIGWKDGKGFVQPMEDEEHVNERRAAVGLEPLEKYAERFGLTWSPPVKKERMLLFEPPKQ